MKAPKIVATTSQKIEIYKILADVLVKEADELFSYKDGYSDEIVARTVAPNLCAHHAAKIRTETLGKLRQAGRKIEPQSLEARIVELEKLYCELSDQVKSLGGQARLAV